MSLEDISKDYKKLLDFVCSSEDVSSVKKLFELLDGFFQSEYYSSPLLIYSLGQNKPKGSSLRESFRSFWNRDKEKIFYESKNIDKVLECILSADDKISWKEVSLEKETFYVLGCGNKDGQDYFGVMKVDKKLNNVVLDYLSQYLETTFQKLLRYSEVDHLKNLVHVDDVTGLYNQRKFIQDIDDAIERYNKSNEVFSVLFIDIDHFKQVNDGHGHLVGTTLLKKVSEILEECVRDTDSCYRYGGDEFVIIIPDSKIDISRKVGERILSKISSQKFQVDEEEGLQGAQEFELSVSIGIANFPDNANSRTEIIGIADKMMYMAKKSGRGRVCDASELVDDEE